MTRNATPARGRPTVESLDEQVDHVRGGPCGGLIVEYGDYECSGHPIARSAEPGEDWSWCYLDSVAFAVGRP